MENKVINIKIVAQIARALKELRDQMVFIGGAVISLYADDPSADEIRPTVDIDMTIKVLNYSDWNKMQERLSKLRFFQILMDTLYVVIFIKVYLLILCLLKMDLLDLQTDGINWDLKISGLKRWKILNCRYFLINIKHLNLKNI